MLTSRGFWFLALSLLTLVVGAFGIATYSVGPALIGLTLVAWFSLENVLFQVRSAGAVSQLKVTRRVLQGGREVPVVWANVSFEVRVTVTNPGSVAVPFAIVEDRAAVAAEAGSGSPRFVGELRAGESREIVYTLKFLSPGVLRFEGVGVRVADLQGFFYRRVFLREGVEFLVLPPLTNDEGQQRATKHFNTLPAPGIHRLRRPGSGDELLDLRDYRPGDPPKMIAWKASARRDRLITKEFENDVPVRCVLFLDTTQGVRLGPPGNTLLTRMSAVAAVVAQAAAANRDLVGLTTFDETKADSLSPARTKIHTINMLRRLAEVAALQPGVTGVSAEHLTDRAYPLAHELYPELMSRSVNSMPWTRLWIPLLDRKWGWVVLTVILTTFIVFGLGVSGIVSRFISFGPAPDHTSLGEDVQAWALDEGRRALMWSLDKAAFFVPRRWPTLLKLLTIFVLVFTPVILSAGFWFVHSARGLFGSRRRELTRRKQLSALLSLLDGTGPDAVERLVHDDAAYADLIARFLDHHLLRCPVPLYDPQGRYRFRCEGKAPVLAEAMVRAVGRARDNELYVVLADLAELGEDIASVVKACRVARSRHHHVLIIVPWPADVPPPDQAGGFEVVPGAKNSPIGTDGHFPKGTPAELREKKTHEAKKNSMMNAVRKHLTRQYHEKFRSLRRQLGQAGATVMRVNDGDPAHLVLDRLDRLRGMRSRR
jgi:uncharacterized protein (DUF58 family)